MSTDVMYSQVNQNPYWETKSYLIPTASCIHVGNLNKIRLCKHHPKNYARFLRHRHQFCSNKILLHNCGHHPLSWQSPVAAVACLKKHPCVFCYLLPPALAMVFGTALPLFGSVLPVRPFPCLLSYSSVKLPANVSCLVINSTRISVAMLLSLLPQNSMNQRTQMQCELPLADNYVGRSAYRCACR